MNQNNTKLSISPYTGEMWYSDKDKSITYAFESINKECDFTLFDDNIFKISSKNVQYLGDDKFLCVNFIGEGYFMTNKVNCIYYNSRFVMHYNFNLKIKVQSINPILSCNNYLFFNKSDTLIFIPWVNINNNN